MDGTMLISTEELMEKTYFFLNEAHYVSIKTRLPTNHSLCMINSLSMMHKRLNQNTTENILSFLFPKSFPWLSPLSAFITVAEYNPEGP